MCKLLSQYLYLSSGEVGTTKYMANQWPVMWFGDHRAAPVYM